ncbi:hypothetical protein C2G38_1524005 [Gigaspora rosea]|uniref:Uncharacterized protein n=1 Tax=Gigaspora rosea TaxID=44941 RepID=A0A397W4T7_9GLOM|nr:hypothetical protein C2G38_1524005 [Gigaspora rosea]
MEKEYKTKRGRIFDIGELVKIRVPDVDKLNMVQRYLPCKILQKNPNYDAYQVACQFGVLENWYSASELEPLGAPDYPALDIVPLNNSISLRKASFEQNNLRLSPSTTQLSHSNAIDNNKFSNNTNFININFDDDDNSDTMSLFSNQAKNHTEVATQNNNLDLCNYRKTNCGTKACSCRINYQLCTRHCGCVLHSQYKNQ